MSIVATPGAANADSYLTVEEADAHFAARLHSAAWTAATTPNKEAALKMATRTIDSRVCFLGTSSYSTQSLRWPISGVVNRNGYVVPSDSIPREVKVATAELALILLGSDVTLQSDVGAQGITRIKAGPVELDFKDSIELQSVPDNVRAIFPPSWLCPSPDATTSLFQML